MRYIDAEKLKERVIRLIASARQNDWPIAEDYLRRVIDIIYSLQQEQPDEQPKYGHYARQYPKSKVSQEQPEVDLEKFTEKIKTFQGRFKHPENISVKGAMAFMARMFYQYPNVARLWYDSLPKATMDNERKEE